MLNVIIEELFKGSGCGERSKSETSNKDSERRSSRDSNSHADMASQLKHEQSAQ